MDRSSVFERFTSSFSSISFLFGTCNFLGVGLRVDSRGTKMSKYFLYLCSKMRPLVSRPLILRPANSKSLASDSTFVSKVKGYFETRRPSYRGIRSCLDSFRGMHY
jgi:hypothetical protein